MPAAEAFPAARPWADLLLRPSRERAELALRLASICALTTFATEYYGTFEPALTAYIAFFLNRPARTTSLILNVAFIVLISIILAIVLLIATFVADAPAWRVVAMVLGSIFFLFLASASKLRPIGAILAMIVAYGLDLLGFVPLGEIATRGLLYAWLFVGIPAGVSIVINLLFAPAPRQAAERGIARRLRAAAAMLGASGEPAPAETEAFEHYRQAGVAEILEQIHLAGIERTLPAEIVPHYKAAAHGTAAILLLADAIRQEPAIPAAWRRDAAATLIAMASAFDQGGYPVGIEPRAPVEATGPHGDGPTIIRDFNDVLARFATVPAEASPPPAQATPKAGFFLPDAFTNPAHLHYAFKTTAAAMVCYFLYVLLDWPGIHTCLITCYIVALPTAAETVEKLGLRILGCLVGGALGMAAIIWVIPAIDSIWGLLLVVFAGAFAGGWAAAGSPRIAYAGFQFAFAFFLCVIQGSGPAFDLTIARDRIIGILIGNVVTYLVFTRLWPVSISRRIEQGFAALLGQLAAMARAPVSARRTQAPVLAGQLAALRGDLALAGYEPEGVRPPPGWSSARRAALAAAAELEHPILLDGDARFWGRFASRLDAIARRAAPPDGQPAGSPGPEPAGAALRPANRWQSQAVEQLLMLEKSLVARP
ncbi:MAG: FUSC family protein [Sphingomonas sp.]|nr:FUSC family protein [Sphingomonas sp.]MDX3886192.1 FUSC family protein [Sphingomonas sp.]